MSKNIKIPDAFLKAMPKIRNAPNLDSQLSELRPTSYHKCGKLRISYSPPHEGLSAVFSVAHPSRYPTWDEMVWIRYNLAPEIEEFAMIMPKMENYINYTDGYGKNTFTMEEVHRKDQGALSRRPTL